MMEAFGLLWLRPGWLALIPVGLVLGIVITRRARDLGAWTQAMDPELLEAMRRMGRITGGTPRRAWLPALILMVLGVALAGPGIERRDVAGFRNLDAVVIVMDLSPSVTEDGQLFDLLTTARIVVERAGTRQVGLIVYAGEAYVAAPLTTDARALTGTLALIDAETMPLQGSNPGAGLALAEKMLTEAKILAADVVLLTDGAEIDANAVASARRLAARNAPVSVIQLTGSPETAALIRTGSGKLATISDPFPVVNHIAGRLAERLGETDYSMLVIRDLGRLLLVAALLLAVFVLPRRGTV